MTQQLIQSFALIPCQKPTSHSRKVVWGNGTVACFGKDGSLFIATEDFARRLINLKDESDCPKLLDALLVSSLDAVFLIVEGFSGVYGCKKGSSLCLPLRCGRLSGGIRTAHPMKTAGARATCLSYSSSHDVLIGGDAWGAIAIWDLGSRGGDLDSDPLVAFGAHGGGGVQSVQLVANENQTDDEWIMVSSNSSEIKLWRLAFGGIDSDNEADEFESKRPRWSCLRILPKNECLPNQDYLSTPLSACFLSPSRLIVCMGTSQGSLIVWPVKPEASISQTQRQEETPLVIPVFNDVECGRVVVDAVKHLNDNITIVCGSAALGQVVTLAVNVKPCDDEETLSVEVIAMVDLKTSGDDDAHLTGPIVGVFQDYVVVDEFTFIKLSDLKLLEHDQQQQQQQQSEREDHLSTNAIDEQPITNSRQRIDLTKAIAYLMTTRAVNRAATRKALNRPINDTSTFGQDLIPISYHSRRRCCRDGPVDRLDDEDGPIWVKRKVKPPKVNPSTRKPLYESGRVAMRADGQLISTVTGQIEKPLPPFCRPYVSKKGDEAAASLYLTERHGQIHCRLVQD